MALPVSTRLRLAALFLLLLAEAAAIPLLAQDGGLFRFLILHAGISLAAALLLPPLFPEAYRGGGAAGTLVLFLLALFLPVLGLTGLIVALLPALHLPRRTPPRLYERIDIPELPFKPLRVSEQPLFGQAGLAGVLRNAPDPERRVQAVMATRQLRDRDAVPILRIALRDPVDDVRLLAYSLLDAKEQRLNQRIAELESELEEASGTARGRLLERIAGLYWEMAYLGLATGEVYGHVLEQALERLEAAERLLPPEMGLRFQKGRVLLGLGRLKEARRALEEARRLGMGSSDVDPYLAEICFLERDWKGVRRHLSSLDPMARAEPPLSLLYAYWNEAP